MGIKENLKKVIELVVARDGDLFNLSQFVGFGRGGTLYCAAGLLAVDPYFMGKGVVFVHNGSGGLVVSKLGGGAIGMGWEDVMFGCDAYSRLFISAGYGVWDRELGHWRLSDKELSLARLRKQWEQYNGN